METDLTVEQAFELSDASAERSAAGCAITLSEEKLLSTYVLTSQCLSG